MDLQSHFESSYFGKKLDKFLRFRNYLRKKPETALISIEDALKIVKCEFNLTSKWQKAVANKVLNFFSRFESVEKFLEIELFEFSPTFSIIFYSLFFIAITKISKPHSCPLSFRYEDLPDAERQDRPHIIELESKDFLGVKRQDRFYIIKLESKDSPGVERQDRPHIIELTSSFFFKEKAPDKFSYLELEGKDSPGVERQDRSRVIGSRARTLLALSDKIVLELDESRIS
ncbi:hypothetical protein TKK_0015680 [Trichogramma kaykai]